MTQYVGCYVDDSSRDMGKNYLDNKSYIECHQSCAMNYISIQFGGQCFCSDDYNTKSKYLKVPDAECGGIGGNGGTWRNAYAIQEFVIA